MILVQTICVSSPSEFLRLPLPPSTFRCRALPTQSFRPHRGTAVAVHFARGLPTHTMFRPQTFSASRRFAPAPTPRACFIPQPRPGFYPSRGFPPLAAGPPHRRPVPPCRWTRDPHRPRDNGRAPCPRLRGFDPQEVAFLGFGDQPPPRPLPSSGFVLPQVLLPRLEFRLPETIRS
jgi:hypothetical protein